MAADQKPSRTAAQLHDPYTSTTPGLLCMWNQSCSWLTGLANPVSTAVAAMGTHQATNPPLCPESSRNYPYTTQPSSTSHLASSTAGLQPRARLSPVKQRSLRRLGKHCSQPAHRAGSAASTCLRSLPGHLLTGLSCCQSKFHAQRHMKTATPRSQPGLLDV